MTAAPSERITRDRLLTRTMHLLRSVFQTKVYDAIDILKTQTATTPRKKLESVNNALDGTLGKMHQKTGTAQYRFATLLAGMEFWVSKVRHKAKTFYTIQPVVKPVVKPLYRVYKHSTGCQTRLTTGLTNGCIVYTTGC